jgi:hypothetical protein
MRATQWRVMMCALAIGAPDAVFAQPYLWLADPNLVSGGLFVTNAPTGSVQRHIPNAIAPRVCSGSMSADGRSYYVSYTSEGYTVGATANLVRFDTTTRELVEFVPVTGLLCGGSLHVSPSNRWFHHVSWPIMQTVTHQVIDAMTGMVVSSRDFRTFDETLVGLRFDLLGLRRFELVANTNETAQLTAFPDGPLAAPLWSLTFDSSFTWQSMFDVGPSGVYLGTPGPSDTWQLRRYDPVTGDELARVDLPGAFHVTYGLGRVWITGATASCEGLLMSLDELTLASLASATVPTCAPHTIGARPHSVFFDRERNVGYWQIEGIHVEFVPYLLAFDLTTLEFGAPYYSRWGSPAENRRPGPVSITTLASSASGVQVAWQPDAAAGAPEAFEIWAGRRNEMLARMAVLDGAARAWQSPPVPSGSYTLEVIARNLVGPSLPSRIDVNVADASLPLAPLNLAADTVNGIARGVVRLTWAALSAGPSPAQYVIEGAPAGSSSFVAVAQSPLPEFFAANAPVGTWQVRVRAATAGGASAPSDTVTVTVVACDAPPSVPTDVVALVSGTTVTIQWTRPTGLDAAEYVIEVGSRADLANLARLTIPARADAFQIVAPSGVYAVRVKARNTCGESGVSNTAILRVS